MKKRDRIKKLGLAALLLSTASFPAVAQVTADRLANPEPENWLMVYGNYQGWRYSELAEIDAGNVSELKIAFAVPLFMQTGLGGRILSSPLVDDGFVYTLDTQGAVTKIDVGTGEAGVPVWRVETTPAENQGRVQGPAFWGNNVYVPTRVGSVVAVDRDSGDVVWERSYVDPGEFFDASPIALANSIIVGRAIGDTGTRGWVVAVDPIDGDELWRTYMVPGPGEPGHETWPQDNDAWETGGGGVWIAPTYDPGSDLLFVGTGNPSPAFDNDFRPGDNLYTASTVALNGTTGEIEWYFQYTPNDDLEHDEVSPHILYDVQGRDELDSRDRPQDGQASGVRSGTSRAALPRRSGFWRRVRHAVRRQQHHRYLAGRI